VTESNERRSAVRLRGVVGATAAGPRDPAGGVGRAILRLVGARVGAKPEGWPFASSVRAARGPGSAGAVGPGPGAEPGGAEPLSREQTFFDYSVWWARHSSTVGAPSWLSRQLTYA
jgi:hypothetical protein